MQRRLEPVVAPEQFAVGGREARRAEDAEPLRLIGLRPQPRFDCIGLGRRECALGIELESRQDVADGHGIVDAASVGELRAKDRAAERFAPGVVEPHQRHARREQTVLRKGIGTPERELQLRA